MSAIARALPTMRARRRFRISTPAAHLVLGVGGFLMMVPFFWLLSSSFKAPHEIFRLPPVFIPETFRWENYYEVLFVQPFPRLVRNTLIVTLPATLGQVLTASMAAYGFARLRFAGRDKVFAVLLATIMLPYAVTLIPVGVVKGLEFDGVVVVEPAAIVDESVQGLRALYVALTRATKRLTVVHARPLPTPLEREEAFTRPEG